MKKDDKIQYNDEACQSGSCGCSANYIWLGIAVILFVMAIALYFGN